jgi:hypothetical protein
VRRLNCSSSSMLRCRHQPTIGSASHQHSRQADSSPSNLTLGAPFSGAYVFQPTPKLGGTCLSIPLRPYLIKDGGIHQVSASHCCSPPPPPPISSLSKQNIERNPSINYLHAHRPPEATLRALILFSLLPHFCSHPAQRAFCPPP